MAITCLKEQIQAADALLFVTPEYSRSMPGVLKNALAGKPALVSGALTSPISTAVAQQHR